MLDSNVFNFTSRKDLTCKENVDAFISKMRDCFSGSQLDWQSDHWNGIGFSKLGCRLKKITAEWRLDDKFIDFAKAYLVRNQVLTPGGILGQHGLTLRVLEAALLQVNGDGSIHRCTVKVLDEAAMIAKNHYSRDTAYGIGLRLEVLAEFLSAHFLASFNLKDWNSPMPRPLEVNNATGPVAEKERKKKLPGEAELNALAEIFSNVPSDPRDIFTTSVFAMLMCAPSRLNEVLALRADAEVEEADKDGNLQYGWRFYSSKGFGGDIKWIPSTMVEIAKTAFSRMVAFSQPARELALWIENNPSSFYRHELCPALEDDDPLTVFQVVLALGGDVSARTEAWNFLNIRGLSAVDGFYTLNSLWAALKNKLPKDFPWFDEKKGIKYSQCVFSMLKHQIHAKNATYPVLLQKPTLSTLLRDLGPRTCVIYHRSIFDRYNYRKENGEPLKLTTHQPRHLLNTIAQRGGLSNFEIAKWSGRAEAKSNRVYNHVGDYEIIARVRELGVVDALSVTGGQLTDYEPLDEDAFLSLLEPAVHVTEYGYCIHDFAMSPCTKFRDCLNCTEQVCVKGEVDKCQRLVERLHRLEHVLLLAKEGEEQGDYGADKWVAYHMKTIARLKELISLLQRDDLSNGAIVRLRGDDFSQLRRVIGKLE